MPSKVLFVMLRNLILCFTIVLFFVVAVDAQEVEVDRYNITARVDPAANAVDLRATLTLTNLSQAPKSRLYLRLAKLAKVSAVSVNGSTAQFETADDRRVTALNQLIITPASPVAGGASASVEVSYRIEAPESTPALHIYQGEVFLAPESAWVPMPSTLFAIYGATTAPFALSVSTPAGFRVFSAGPSKGDAGNQSFDQSMNSLPFLLGGVFDQPLASEHGGVKIEIAVQPGIAPPVPLKPGSASIAGRLAEESGLIVDFVSRLLGPPPAGATFRVVSSVRAGNIVVPGALVLNEQVFRRDTLNAGTIETLADAVARIWLDGRVRVRGQDARAAAEGRPAQKARSAAVLRDSLPRYLAALYIDERFGHAAGRDAFGRMRWAYTPVAQSGRDAELGVQTITLPNYTAAVFDKGPLVLRLIAESMGREKFLSVIKALFSGAQTKIVTSDDLRGALVKAGGPDIEKLFQQWIDSIIEPDVIVGAPLPSDKPGTSRLNLRNLGTGDVTIPVVAITASGAKVSATATVPSENLTSVELATSEKITSVEVDPDKLWIQTNYDNDARDSDGTLRVSAQTLFNTSIATFNKGQFADAEATLRQAVRREPSNPLLHAWLARALAAQKKMDEAAAEATAAIKAEPPVGSALAWSRVTLGQAALARNQIPDAIREFKLALADAEEAPVQFAARDALIQAGRQTGAAAEAIDEPVRSYVTQLDAAIKQAASDKLFTMVIKSNLKKFVQGLTVSHPASWTTEILRADRIDATRIALDVGLKVRADNKDQSGTAVFILNRVDGNWMLEDVQLFNVK
jgi:tetratricopeptide repeat protein